MKKEILCTLGPATMNDYCIKRLEDLGVNLFRFNLSHTKIEDLERVIAFLQERTTVPICLDTEGAQVRTGMLKKGKVDLVENNIVTIQRNPVAGNERHFNLYPQTMIDQLRIGDLISIDFDSVLVQAIGKEQGDIQVRVLTGGTLAQNKAVSVDRPLVMEPLTDKDREALDLGIKMGIRHFALSFANRVSDLEEIRAIVGKDAFLIAKIESIGGWQNLEALTRNSDAILLDRGDLSRQIPIEQIPRMQKDIIQRAKGLGSKVYVATNLLETMVTGPNPTRAEVNDIFNTLNDGADGLVLAAETAIGAFPVQSAMMVSKVIKQYLSFAKGELSSKAPAGEFMLLAEPHGGVLVNRVQADPDFSAIRDDRVLDVDMTTLMDAEQIALGTFSPLEGFMHKADVHAVLKDYRLSSGMVWPLPVCLQTNNPGFRKVKKGERVALRLEGTQDIYATVTIRERYTMKLDEMARLTFGTDDSRHPGVRLLKRKGEIFLAGDVRLLKRLPSPHKYYELTPLQARTIFENKGWSRIVGFHTRNVVHRAHEHIQMLAFEEYHCDGLFVHPVIGPKKKGDYSAGMILKSYELMKTRFYPRGKIVLGAFQSYSRYSGPREAVFTALCRKNFGCSHFIVGRDHTGVGNFYQRNAAHDLFDQLGPLGITPIFFDQVHYCKRCKDYVEHCLHSGEQVHISGTESREILRAQQRPPKWFMREEIASLIVEELKKGGEVFVE